MPSNLHYFLVNYLQLIRLNFAGVDTFEMGYVQGQDVLINKNLENPFLSPLLMMCGYKHPFSPNMIIIFSLLAFFASAVLALVYYDRKTNKTFAPYACNFTLRFVYEFIFEVFLTMLILSASLGSG